MEWCKLIHVTDNANMEIVIHGILNDMRSVQTTVDQYREGYFEDIQIIHDFDAKVLAYESMKYKIITCIRQHGMHALSTFKTLGNAMVPDSDSKEKHGKYIPVLVKEYGYLCISETEEDALTHFRNMFNLLTNLVDEIKKEHNYK